MRVSFYRHFLSPRTDKRLSAKIDPGSSIQSVPREWHSVCGVFEPQESSWIPELRSVSPHWSGMTVLGLNFVRAPVP